MNERTKTKTVRNIIVSIVVVFLLAIFVLGFVGYRYVTNSLEPIDEGSEEVVEVEIPTGSNRRQIGAILEEEELINSALIFEYYVRFQGENNFQAGTYAMSPSMSMDEIISYLNEGGTPIAEKPIAQVTVPEGIHLEEIAEKVENDTDFSSEDFMELVQDDTFIEEVSTSYPKLLTHAIEASESTRYTLEGYLFPATYDIYEATTLDDLVKQMIARMDQALQPHYDEIESSQWNVHEILTLSSYIEREGVTDEDRGQISGVFYNRLEEGMPLQTDPSVSYAHGEHRERTTYKDLEIDSPYNTYKYAGVGPGPINSPSEAAIQASVNPIETTAMYFLADLKTGNVYFSDTYEQHLEYQNKYLRNNN